MPGTGLQLAGRPGHAAVWLLFCFRENGIIGCCGCGIGARDWMLGKRACVCVCVCPYLAGQGQASAQWENGLGGSPGPCTDPTALTPTSALGLGQAHRSARGCLVAARNVNGAGLCIS